MIDPTRMTSTDASVMIAVTMEPPSLPVSKGVRRFGCQTAARCLSPPEARFQFRQLPEWPCRAPQQPHAACLVCHGSGDGAAPQFWHASYTLAPTQEVLSQGMTW